MRRCHDEQDYAGFVGLLADEEVARMTGMMLQSSVGLALIHKSLENSPNPSANPDLQECKEFLAIVERYTVDEPDSAVQKSFHQIAAIGEWQAASQSPGVMPPLTPLPDWNAEQYSLHLRTAARVISDPRAFVADMMETMEQFTSSATEPRKVEWKLNIHGDQAIATTDSGTTMISTLTPATMSLQKVGHSGCCSCR